MLPVLLSAVVAASAAPGASAGGDGLDVETLEAVVLLRQGSTTCAGVHLGGGVIATAYHCVAAGGRPSITSRRGDRWIGRVRSVSAQLDLALVDISSEGPTLDGALPDGALAELSIGPPPEVGAPVWALGHPLAADPPAGLLAGTLRWSVADGAVAAVGPHVLQITAPLNPGHSGGPVVDGSGRVVGVVSRRLAGQGLGFATRVDPIPALLARGRGWSPAGGTFALHVVGLTQAGGDGGNAIGVRAEIAARDRVLLDVAAYAPLSPRWSAARFGATASALGEARVGLRQRIGRGPWALRVDGTLGIAAVERWSRPPNQPLALRSAVEPAPILAAQISSRTAGFELGWVLGTDISRAALVLRWPGVIRVW
jgi:hypothetical protein